MTSAFADNGLGQGGDKGGGNTFLRETVSRDSNEIKENEWDHSRGHLHLDT